MNDSGNNYILKLTSSTIDSTSLIDSIFNMGIAVYPGDYFEFVWIYKCTLKYKYITFCENVPEHFL